MRKPMLWLLMTILCLSVMIPAALAGEEAPPAWGNMWRVYEKMMVEKPLAGEDDAIALAMMAVSGKVSMLQTDLDAYTVEATDKGDGDTWRVSLTHPKYPELSCVFTVSLSEMGYTEVEPRDYWERHAAHYDALQTEIESHTTEWEKRLGQAYALWPYTEKAAFAAEYGRQPGFYGDILCGLPGEDDLTYEEAMAIAKETCVTRMGADAGVLETLLVNAEFQPNAPIDGDTQWGRVWSILFREPELNDQGYYTQRYTVRIQSPGGEVIYLDEDDGTSNG